MNVTPFILSIFINWAHANETTVATKFRDTNVAQRCTTKSQEKKIGATRDQGSTQWCFAYSAADLLTHELGLGPKKQVSALWTGAMYDGTSMSEFDRLYARNWKNRGSDVPDDAYTEAFKVRQAMAVRNRENKSRLQESTGGFVENALEIAIAQDKICLTSDLGKYESKMLDPVATLAVIEYKMSKEKSKKIDECKSEGKNTAETNRSDLADVAMSIIEEQKNYLKDRCSHQLKTKKNYSVKEEFYRNPEQPMSPEYREEALTTINNVLNNDKILAMAYQSRVITAKDSGPHALHSSTIIGRKLINGKCFYQVRNSWGPSCNGYKKDPTVRCEHGGSIYVEENALMENIMGIQYLQEAGT